MAQAQESALIGSILDEPTNPIRSADGQKQQQQQQQAPSAQQRVSPSHPTPTRRGANILEHDDDDQQDGRGAGGGGGNAGEQDSEGTGAGAGTNGGGAGSLAVSRPAAGLIQRSTSAPPQLALQGLLHDATEAAGADGGADLNEPGGGGGVGFNTNPAYAPQPSAAHQQSSGLHGDAANGVMIINGETIRADDQRLSQEYYHYYFSQKPLDPRLPPPLINWSNWHPRHQLHGGAPGHFAHYHFDAQPHAHHAHAGDAPAQLRVADSPQIGSTGSSALLGPTAADLTALSSLDALQDADGDADGGAATRAPGMNGRGGGAPLLSSVSGDPDLSAASSVSPGSSEAEAMESRLAGMSLATTASDGSSSGAGAGAGSALAGQLAFNQQAMMQQMQQQMQQQPQSHQQQAQSHLYPPSNLYAPGAYYNPSALGSAVDPSTFANPAAMAAAAFFSQQQQQQQNQAYGTPYRGLPGAMNPQLLALLNYQQQLLTANQPGVGPLLVGRVPVGGATTNPLLPLTPLQHQQAAAAAAATGVAPPHASPAEIQAAMQMYSHLRNSGTLSVGGVGGAPGTQALYGGADFRPPQQYGQQGQTQFGRGGGGGGGGGGRSRDQQSHDRYAHSRHDGHQNHQGGRGPRNSHRNQHQQHSHLPGQTFHMQAANGATPSALNLPMVHIGMDGSMQASGGGGGRGGGGASTLHLFPQAGAHAHSHAHPGSHGPGGGHGVAGHGHPSWHDEFRNSKTNAHLTLHDVVARGVLLDLATDQHGSRFLQQRLEVAGEAEKQAACEAVLPELLRLSHDVFGNYVVQKFIEHGTLEQRRSFVRALRGNVFLLSLQMYGTRVVQRLLSVSAGTDVESQAALVSELEGRVMQCVKDQNGNHVIQAALSVVPADLIGFIVDVFHRHVYQLSIHPYGCRCVQRLLEHCSDARRASVLEEILDNIDDLCKNQYGNYVVQHILIHGEPWHKAAILSAITGVPNAEANKARAAAAAAAGTTTGATATAATAGGANAASTAANGNANGHGNGNGSTSASPNRDGPGYSPGAGAGAGSPSLAAHSSTVPPKVLQMAKHKFASNVVEKCWLHAGPRERMDLIDQILGRENERQTDSLNSPFLSLVKDQYGNYVVQGIVDNANDEERAIIIQRIKRQGANLRKIPYGKHIIAKIEKLTGVRWEEQTQQTPQSNSPGAPSAVPVAAPAATPAPAPTHKSLPTQSQTPSAAQ